MAVRGGARGSSSLPFAENESGRKILNSWPGRRHPHDPHTCAASDDHVHAPVHSEEPAAGVEVRAYGREGLMSGRPVVLVLVVAAAVAVVGVLAAAAGGCGSGSGGGGGGSRSGRVDD